MGNSIDLSRYLDCSQGVHEIQEIHESILGCPICFEPYSPKRERFELQCQHSLCKPCLESMQLHALDSCPFCRQVFNIENKFKSVQFIKLCAMGDYGVDKFLRSFTMSDSFQFRTMLINNTKVRIQVYDFQEIPRAQEIQGVLFCYDITNRRSYENLKNFWVPKLDHHPNINKSRAKAIIVGMYCEQEHRREVSSEEAHEWAISKNFGHIEVSTAIHLNIELAFSALSSEILS